MGQGHIRVPQGSQEGETGSHHTPNTTAHYGGPRAGTQSHHTPECHCPLWGSWGEKSHSAPTNTSVHCGGNRLDMVTPHPQCHRGCPRVGHGHTTLQPHCLLWGSQRVTQSHRTPKPHCPPWSHHTCCGGPRVTPSHRTPQCHHGGPRGHMVTSHLPNAAMSPTA